MWLKIFDEHPLYHLREILHMTQAEFADEMSFVGNKNYEPTQISKFERRERNISKPLVQYITMKWPCINPKWLREESEDMFLKQPPVDDYFHIDTVEDKYLDGDGNRHTSKKIMRISTWSKDYLSLLDDLSKETDELKTRRIQRQILNLCDAKKRETEIVDLFDDGEIRIYDNDVSDEVDKILEDTKLFIKSIEKQ